MSKYMPEGHLFTSEKNYSYISSLDGLERAMRDNATIEALAVLWDHNLNLYVELGEGIKGIIPKEDILYRISGEETKDIAILTRVGKIVAFKVMGISQSVTGEIIAKLSRKEAQKECYHEYISGMRPGDIIPCRVTHIENFGAFVDLGCGIISLLSIDSISVSRISHPGDRIKVGENIYAVVKSIDSAKRISVSCRELLGTWEENAATFNEGETVCGVIRSVESYGIFVELKPNLAGLAEYKDNIAAGQGVTVYIKSIIPEKMKIKLSIIDTYSQNTAVAPMEYFINPNEIKHIDKWTYSPRVSGKNICTCFS